MKEKRLKALYKRNANEKVWFEMKNKKQNKTKQNKKETKGRNKDEHRQKEGTRNKA